MNGSTKGYSVVVTSLILCLVMACTSGDNNSSDSAESDIETRVAATVSASDANIPQTAIVDDVAPGFTRYKLPLINRLIFPRTGS